MFIKEDFPLVEALEHNLKQIRFRFHIPARNTSTCKYELTELPGLDNLASPGGVIQKAQQLASDFFGSDNTFFLVNGSTSGITAAIWSACRKGEKILLPRNLHKSAVAGLVFSGAQPVYAPVEYLGEAGLPLNVSSPMMAACMEQSKPRAVLVNHPSYEGIAAALPPIRAAAENKDIVFIVDEAHGGHFSLSPLFPAGASETGAHIWVNSAHKTLGSLTPAALLHTAGRKADTARLEFALHLLQTSSPSYPVMASLDLVRRTKPGEWSRLAELAASLREKIDRDTGFTCLKEADLPHFSLDPLRVVILTTHVALNGFQTRSMLREEMGIEVEMAGLNYILVLVQPGTKMKAVKALVKALRDIGKKYYTSKAALEPESNPYPIPPQKMTPGEASEKMWREVHLSSAPGEIAANTVCPFPPGIPALVPGELILPETGERIVEQVKQGVCFQGITDGGCIRVVNA